MVSLCNSINFCDASKNVHKKNIHCKEGKLSISYNRRKYSCKSCDQVFYNKQNLQNHMDARMKTNGWVKKCNVCSFQSCTMIGLSIHKKISHNKKDQKLQENQSTPKKFKEISSTRKINEKKPKENTFHCTDCNEEFLSKLLLD